MTIMQDQPSPYTAYARSLCPSWCSEPHDEHTDPNDRSAVRHSSLVASVGGFDVRADRWDSMSGGEEPACVHLDNAELSPVEAVELGMSLIRAAEAARRG